MAVVAWNGDSVPEHRASVPENSRPVPRNGGPFPVIFGKNPVFRPPKPANGGAVPADGQTVGRDDGTVPANGRTVGGNGETVGENGGAVPRDSGAVGGDGGTVPGNGATVPRNGGTVGGNGGAVGWNGGSVGAAFSAVLGDLRAGAKRIRPRPPVRVVASGLVPNGNLHTVRAMKRIGLVLVGFVLLSGWAAAAADFGAGYAAVIASKGGTNDAQRLHQLFALDWDYQMDESPESATHYGYPGHNHRWSDVSLDAIARRKRELQRPLAVLRSIDRAALSGTDPLSYDLFKREVERAMEGARYPEELFAVSPLHGVQQGPANLLALMPAAKVADYENIVARLRGFSTVVDQNIALLREGLKRGITPPAITLRDVPQQAKNQVADDPIKSPMLKAFTQFPKEIAAPDRERLRAAAVSAYRDVVRPAYERLHKFLGEEYVPKCRTTVGLGALPDGKAWYAFRARTYTTTSLTPREIHELGGREVRRIRAEMDTVIAKTGFKGSFDQFLEFLRTDKQFYFERGTELIAAYRDICKRADVELPKLFGKLPRLPYGVQPVPGFSEKSQTTAYYQPGSPRVGRAGIYFANTYALNTRPKWEMEALSLHEAVPGHHLQIALAQELDGLPEFRRHGHFTAFVEGWGLYSESLGEEMGFYQDPYMKFGQLTYEMWRAIRLVVDTGLHELGWSRQQAIDFFLKNASKNAHDITVEVDRYLNWPGQALAYKIGELKLKELRADATRELGERFDVRAFHDEVLGAGALPLDLLEARIKAWVAERKRAR